MAKFSCASQRIMDFFGKYRTRVVVDNNGTVMCVQSRTVGAPDTVGLTHEEFQQIAQAFDSYLGRNRPMDVIE